MVLIPILSVRSPVFQGHAIGIKKEVIFYFTFKSILSLYSRLFELTEKIAVLQGKPVIVKPMPGRPNAQNPARRGREHFQKGAI